MIEFYPTPPALAKKLVDKFNSKNYKRILEPSAGRGDLADVLKRPYTRYLDKIDCVEFDLDNQAILRSKGFNVVGMDFLEYSGRAMYSHIIMNPPFSRGVDHVLKAWDLLFDGELVAIINANSIRNPSSTKAKFLADLVSSCGSVEYIESAFLSPDTQRKTAVEVALIHLAKKSDFDENLSNLLNDLKEDEAPELERTEHQDLSIKESSIVHLVKIFNNAVSYLEKSCKAQAEANYFGGLLGKNNSNTGVLNSVFEDYNKGYEELRELAWRSVLNSTEFNRHLSSKAYQRLDSDFEQVSKLEFTESNIRAFLVGLIEGKAQYNLEMVLDTFDSITKYHSENRAYYKGWKSNDKHKSHAYRVKMTRFILPLRSHFSSSITWESTKLLEDFDKTFALLDGKYETEVSLRWLFDNNLNDLLSGQRLSTTYFDVRYYGGAGTAHFFPKNKPVIDRLNRLVGKERQWLPDEDTQANDSFWLQYEKAEKITAKMGVDSVSFYDHNNDIEKIKQLHEKACSSMGIDPDKLTQIAA